MTETPPPHDPTQPPPPPPPSERKGRSGCLKALLIGGGLLAAVVVIGGILIAVWWRNNRDELQSSAVEGVRAGVEAARGRDEAGCVALSRERAAGSGGVSGMMGEGMFLRACLENAGEAPGLCEGAPVDGGMIAQRRWIGERCEAEGGSQGEAAGCAVRMQTVLEYCEAGRPKAFRGDPGATSADILERAAEPADTDDIGVGVEP